MFSVFLFLLTDSNLLGMFDTSPAQTCGDMTRHSSQVNLFSFSLLEGHWCSNFHFKIPQVSCWIQVSEPTWPGHTFHYKPIKLAQLLCIGSVSENDLPVKPLFHLVVEYATFPSYCFPSMHLRS